MAHALVNFSGFELQDTVEFLASSGGAVETTTVFGGAAARRFNVSAGTAYAEFGSSLSATGEQSTGTSLYVWYAYQVYIDSLPGSGQRYYLDVTNSGHELWIDENGSLWLSDSAGANDEDTGLDITTGEWYTVARKSRSSTAGLRNGVALYNTTAGTQVGSTVYHSNAGGGGCTSILIGPSLTSTGNAVFDNFVLESDATEANIDNPVGLLGTNFTVLVMTATADGDYDDAEWTNDYQAVDELPPDGDTSYRACTTNGDVKFTQVMSDPATLNSYDAVKGSLVANFGGNTGTALLVRSGATDVEKTNAGSSDYVQRAHVMTVDPATSSAWLVAGVNDIEVGADRDTGGIEVRVTAVYAEVLGEALAGDVDITPAAASAIAASAIAAIVFSVSPAVASAVAAVAGPSSILYAISPAAASAVAVALIGAVNVLSLVMFRALPRNMLFTAEERDMYFKALKRNLLFTAEERKQ